jgi:hypothetical protein
MNTASLFSESAELTISLKPFGRRAGEVGNQLGQLPDCIKLRGRADACELYLVKSENRTGWNHSEEPTVTLVKLPWEFFGSLPYPLSSHRPFEDNISHHHRRQREILERAGLKYQEYEAIYDGWDYKGKYADLHWWTF